MPDSGDWKDTQLWQSLSQGGDSEQCVVAALLEAVMPGIQT